MTTRAPSVGAAPGDAGPTAAGYAAIRIPLPTGAPLDPFALAGGSGVVVADGRRALVGLGRARTLGIPGGLADGAGVDAVTSALAGIACDDRLGRDRAGRGHAVVAFGALPFDRSSPAALVVPELTYGREPDGT